MLQDLKNRKTKYNGFTINANLSHSDVDIKLEIIINVHELETQQNLTELYIELLELYSKNARMTKPSQIEYTLYIKNTSEAMPTPIIRIPFDIGLEDTIEEHIDIVAEIIMIHILKYIGENKQDFKFTPEQATLLGLIKIAYTDYNVINEFLEKIDEEEFKKCFCVI